jgi:hypothetical protein
MTESAILERLAGLQPNWADVERRSLRLRRRHVRRQALLAVAIVVGMTVLAGGAYAAARAIWSGHNLTPAGIDAQATTVYNDKWSVCDPFPHCKNETGTHTQVNILPSMGVVFVLPDGDSTSLVPAVSIWNIPAAGGPGAPIPPKGSQGFRDDSGNQWGTAYPLKNPAGGWSGGVWTVSLPGGGTRTITWKQATGAVTVSDTVSGLTTTTQLTAGDVVPLVPGSVSDDPRTLDKAVTFDMPYWGTRVIIFPQLNETYINWVKGPHEAEPLARGEAAEYGLTPVGEYNGKLPVTSSGGTWTAHLPGGLTRTISWHAGDSYVTVEDTTASGTTSTQVPIGHELPLVPFK